MQLVLIGVAGFCGAIARYMIDTLVTRAFGATFPWGTLAVNTSGSLLLGLLFALMVERGIGTAELRTPILVGFVGTYTTFSTYMLDSWRVLEQGNAALAVVNLIGSVVIGLIALVLGLSLGRLV